MCINFVKPTEINEATVLGFNKPEVLEAERPRRAGDRRRIGDVLSGAVNGDAHRMASKSGARICCATCCGCAPKGNTSIGSSGFNRTGVWG